MMFIYDVSVSYYSANYFSFSLCVVALLDFVLKWGYLHQTSLQSHNDAWLPHVYPVKKYQKCLVIILKGTMNNNFIFILKVFENYFCRILFHCHMFYCLIHYVLIFCNFSGFCSL